MRPFQKLLTTAVLSVAALSAGCAAHYRVYDGYRGDYHHWDHNEDAYYHRWVVETHHNSEDYKRLKPDDQKQYWEWRHNQH